MIKLTQKMRAALEFAAQCHAGVLDKGGVPYICHPFQVALGVYHLGEDAFIAGVLHDVYEDCKGQVVNGEVVSLELIEDKFGSNVREIVDSVSRRPQETYMDFVRRFSWNVIGTEIKLSDLNHNTLPERMANLSPEKQERNTQRYDKAKKFLREVRKAPLSMEVGLHCAFFKRSLENIL
jgi:hypothetical protein